MTNRIKKHIDDYENRLMLEGALMCVDECIGIIKDTFILENKMSITKEELRYILSKKIIKLKLDIKEKLK